MFFRTQKLSKLTLFSKLCIGKVVKCYTFKIRALENFNLKLNQKLELSKKFGKNIC